MTEMKTQSHGRSKFTDCVCSSVTTTSNSGGTRAARYGKVKGTRSRFLVLKSSELKGLAKCVGAMMWILMESVVLRGMSEKLVVVRN